MGTRTIVETIANARFPCEHDTFVPDKSPFESSTAHEARVIQYLNQRFPHGWHYPIRSKAAQTDAQSLLRADQDGAKQIQILERRAQRSLDRLARKYPLPRR